MKLDNRKLYELLREKNVRHLYHANTVATSITFLRQHGLLSRGEVKKRGLVQTYQKSDFKDKRVGVWFDIFLDTCDLHSYFPRQNLYGPVLFKFSTRLLLKRSYDVWVTKSNPIEWNNLMTRRDRYFNSVSELKKHWTKGNAQQRMVTLRLVERPVLFRYLEEIILDDPLVLLNDVDIFRKAQRALRKTINENDCDASILRRKCSNCFCTDNYYKMHPAGLGRLFHPSGSEF